MTGDRTPECPPLAAGAYVAPGYQVLAHLYRTGWLDLYDAWSEERDCRCVVKVLRPGGSQDGEYRARLVQEGRWLAEFTHPHLVRAYETVAEPEPYVVLETLTGETLDRLLERRRRRLAAGDLALLGVQLCSAAHYLHGRGLLHLDIKPANVVIDCRRAKLLDLSIARPPGPGPPGAGTRGYLAPEQARGGELTAATDVWGIGATLYEAATGDPPHDPGATGTGNSWSGSWSTGAEDTPDPGEPPPVPPVTTRRRLPAGLAEAIDGALRPGPGARPTVRALAALLDAQAPQGRRAVRPPEEPDAPEP
ncbi:serine/threonine-protein kinase [Streptomyces sp. NPDC049577]|uniref:serine/threonine-protein kinase n=1 Tax=Streptomyces sp. NPDC049577 TaxID=3155153 RepID=UPI00342E79FF